MKLRFEPDLAHQLQAVAAACDWVLLLQRDGLRELGFVCAAKAGDASLVPAHFSPICCG